MLIERKGNLLDSHADYICHQVNGFGIMGGGLAKQIKDIAPTVYEKYSDYCRINEYNEQKMFGNVLCVKSEELDAYIVNIFSQENLNNVLHTNTEALEKALTKLNNIIEDGKVVAFPYKYGCGIADGNWDEIKPIIESFSKKIHGDVEIWEYTII